MNKVTCFALFVSFVITGCATAPTNDEREPDANATINSPTGASGSRSDVSTRVPRADEQSDVEPENAAVTFLLNSAEGAIEENEHAKAQALVDRALRIQRTAARAYLVAARIQMEQGDEFEAQNLARQGVVYALDGSPTALNLRKILDGGEM